MKGLGGLNGWQWIFAIVRSILPHTHHNLTIPKEGATTILLGLLPYLLILDFPDKATHPSPLTKHPFLTPHEAHLVLTRIQRDRGDAVVDTLTLRLILHHLSDWKIWEFAWLYLLNNLVTYNFGYFLPIILKDDMGYSTSKAQLLSFPPYMCAGVYMLLTAYLADHYRRRGPFIIFNCIVAIVGVCMMAFVGNSGARYAGVYLGVAGANSNIPSILSYMHNNIVGQMMRSFASALLIGGGACGGIAASNIFRQQDAPMYTYVFFALLMVLLDCALLTYVIGRL